MSHGIPERRPRVFKVRSRPYCAEHLETLMVMRWKRGRIAYYQCPVRGCHDSWKGPVTIEGVPVEYVVKIMRRG